MLLFFFFPPIFWEQFGPGGHAYVYLCYGLHMMLNVVADKEGVGAAVLIRACAPIRGTYFPSLLPRGSVSPQLRIC